MTVYFLHPRDSRTFSADIDPETTGTQCIQGLEQARFLASAPPNQPYTLQLQRTQQQILPATSMQEAGVQDNDQLAVLQREQGAQAT